MLLTETKKIFPEEVVQIMLNHLPKDEDIIMTTAEQLIHKGKLEGIQEGMHVAKLQIARELLLEGRGIGEICKITQLSIEEVTQLQKK